MARVLEDIHIGPSGAPALSEGYRWEPSKRRVRALFGGETVADSRRVMLLLEFGRLPVFYFPVEDVRMDLLERTDHQTSSPLKGDATYYTLRADDKVAENAAWSYENPPADGPAVQGYVAFYWNKMDAWYEEDQQVFGHARDPYKRVDILPTSRHIRVVLGGETIADTRRAKMLLETGLLTRYYIPEQDVRMDLLQPTARTSRCPYKGQATYWTARIGDSVHEDVVWTYRDPLPECLPIAGYLCFYNERVDAIEVDGEAEAKTRTMWS